jgi:8-oxo-dGTP pyrophosphatase MutT (NUDIX family)
MSFTNKMHKMKTKSYNFRKSRERHMVNHNFRRENQHCYKNKIFWNNKHKYSSKKRNSFNISYCSNCGFKGHIYKNCTEPKISLGIIAFKYFEKTQEYKYLLICRKHTLGFVELIRGKYMLNDIDYIQRLIDQLTIREKILIQTKSFIDLWNILWYSNDTEDEINGIRSKKQKKEFNIAKDKFMSLLNGYILNKYTQQIYENIHINDIKILYNFSENEQPQLQFDHITISKLVSASNTRWVTPEWGFPKGRRNLKETNLECSKREFMEETGIKEHQLEVFYNVNVPEEIFNGTNDLPYKHIYYLGRVKDYVELKIDVNKKSQASEIGDLGFYTLDKCLEHIRPYNKEKIKILLEINSFITANKLNNKTPDFHTNVSTYNFQKGGKLIKNH